MEIKEEKPLIIPENCPPVEYLIAGFTKVDASYVLLAGLAGAVLGIAIWVKGGNSIIGVAVFFLVVMIAVSIFGRNEQTENLIDKVRILREYQKAQKKFEYEYVNIWEVGGKRQNATSRKQSSGT